jgi:hypothetical protein
VLLQVIVAVAVALVLAVGPHRLPLPLQMGLVVRHLQMARLDLSLHLEVGQVG